MDNRYTGLDSSSSSDCIGFVYSEMLYTQKTSSVSHYVNFDKLLRRQTGGVDKNLRVNMVDKPPHILARRRLNPDPAVVARVHRANLEPAVLFML